MAVGFGHGAAGYDIVNVGVIGHHSSPCMQDAEKARQVRADEFFVPDQFFNGGRRGCKHGCIARTLMASDKMTDIIGNGECNHKMVNWQLLMDPFFKPLPGFVMLTVGAVSIAAAAENQVFLATVFALIKTCTEVIRTAVDDGVDGFVMFNGHGVPETPDIFGTVDLHDVFNRCHGRILSSGC